MSNKYKVDDEAEFDEEDDEEPPRYAESSMGMSRRNCFRVAARTLMEYRWFGNLSLIVIGFNCITLAAWDPTDKDNDTTRNLVLRMR